MSESEVINLSSDSDTSVEDITEILNKCTNKNKNVEKPAETDNLFDSDDDLKDIRSLQEKLRLKYCSGSDIKINNIDSSLDKDNSKDNTNTAPTSQKQNSENLDLQKPKKNQTDGAERRQIAKEQKEREKLEKQAEKERLKEENARKKAMKQALASTQKNLKPEESIKLMTTLIDSNLISHTCGMQIPVILQDANISFKLVTQKHPFVITWSRQTQSHLTPDGQLSLSKNEEYCNEVIVIMLWNEIIDLVYTKQFSSKFQTLIALFSGKKIHLGIFGLENYFKHQKQKRSSKNTEFANTPKVLRKDIDMALIEVQILYGITHRFLETAHDVGNMVVQFTKSIAQIPYKLQKQLKEQQMDWFVAGDNKDSVRVDKSGNGLQRVWQQQLTQFTLARLETAEAISSKYASPTILIKAYENCSTVEDGEKLLQDIPIRRAAGPLTSVRKIGPELSKKVHTLFTSTDGSEFI